MGWSAFYKSAKTMKDETAIELFKTCIDSGVTLFNSAVFYGPLTQEGYGANLRLLNKCLKAPGVDRSKIQIMVKIGMDTRPPEGYEGPPGKVSFFLSSILTGTLLELNPLPTTIAMAVLLYPS